MGGSRRVATQGNPFECAEGITRRERACRRREQRVHWNPDTLVTLTIRYPALIYLTTTAYRIENGTSDEYTDEGREER